MRWFGCVLCAALLLGASSAVAYDGEDWNLTLGGELGGRASTWLRRPADTGRLQSPYAPLSASLGGGIGGFVEYAPLSFVAVRGAARTGAGAGLGVAGADLSLEGAALGALWTGPVRWHLGLGLEGGGSYVLDAIGGDQPVIKLGVAPCMGVRWRVISGLGLNAELRVVGAGMLGLSGAGDPRTAPFVRGPDHVASVTPMLSLGASWTL